MISILGLVLELIGTIMIAYTVLRVHERLQEEHKIDEIVLKEIEGEKTFVLLGMVLIVLGFIFQIIGYI